MTMPTNSSKERTLPVGVFALFFLGLLGCNAPSGGASDVGGPVADGTSAGGLDGSDGLDDSGGDAMPDDTGTDDATEPEDTGTVDTGIVDTGDGDPTIGPGEDAPSCREVCDRVYDECGLFLLYYTADKVPKSGCVNACKWGYFVGERSCIMQNSCGKEALNSCIAVEPAEADLESAEPGSDWPTSWKKYEQQAYALANLHRRRGVECGDRDFEPTPPFEYHPKVAEAAQSHSLDMARNGFYGHEGADGSLPSQRLAEAGYSATASGEGINRTFGDPFSAVKSWLESPSHCARMTSPRHPYEHVGLGYVRAPDAEYEHYWTITYGAN